MGFRLKPPIVEGGRSFFISFIFRENSGLYIIEIGQRTREAM
jgi:hypothetical protein